MVPHIGPREGSVRRARSLRASLTGLSELPSFTDPDANDAQTRAFYTALGFTPLFETTALWGPESPALVLVKALG